MKYLIIALLIIAAIPAQAQQGPQAIQVENGIAAFGWENDVQADTVAVLLNRDDCRSPGLYHVNPTEAQQSIQVPRTTDDARCLIRLGDVMTLLLYRDGVYVGQRGPYTQRGRVLLPMVRSE